MADIATHIVIVGAGHAGGSAAAYLRQYGHQGPITLIGEEPIPPYQRPPLSKAWLKGEADAESLALKPMEFYSANAIDFRPNVRAVAIDPSVRQVRLSDGGTLSYDRLILATGARAIALPVTGADLDGVLSLRTAHDAERLKAALGPGKRLAVIGGGYVGLEVAASGRALGASVMVFEREPRLLARVACAPLADFFAGYHQARGVDIEVSCTVVEIIGAQGAVNAVRLGDGRRFECDVVVVGVGAAPNDQLAIGAGLKVDSGVVVDLEGRTSDPSIFAIGDVTRRPVPVYGCMMRVESVPNALEQAKQVASALTGRSAPTPEVPWQWSDQYDLKLQIAGYPVGADSIVIRGEPESGKFSVFHLEGDVVRSVEAINAPPEFMMGKQLIASRAPVDRARLADPSVSMKAVTLAATSVA